MLRMRSYLIRSQLNSGVIRQQADASRTGRCPFAVPGTIFGL